MEVNSVAVDARSALRRWGVVAGFLFGFGVLAVATAQEASADGLLDDVTAPVVHTVGGVVEPVVESVEPVVESVAQVTTPVVQAVEPAAKPVLQAVEPVTKPVLQAVEPVTKPVLQAVAPVVKPVLRTVDPVLQAVEPVTAPVLRVVDPVTKPVLQAVAPVVEIAVPATDEVERVDPAPPATPAQPPTPEPVREVPVVQPDALPTAEAVQWSGPVTAEVGRKADHPVAADTQRENVPAPSGNLPGIAPVSTTSIGSSGAHHADNALSAVAFGQTTAATTGRSPPQAEFLTQRSGYDERNHPS